VSPGVVNNKQDKGPRSAVLPYINGGLHLGVLVLPLFQRRALVSWR